MTKKIIRVLGIESSCDETSVSIVEKIDNKLFQTRIFFPAKSIPGEYKVNVYQIKNNLILNSVWSSLTLSLIHI